LTEGLIYLDGEVVRLTREGKEALLPDEQHPVWALYAEMRHLPELPVPYNDPAFVFIFYDLYQELPTKEDYEELCGSQSFTEEQAEAPVQDEPLPNPATPAILCELPSEDEEGEDEGWDDSTGDEEADGWDGEGDDDGDDDPDDTPPSGTFSDENPYIEDESLMEAIEGLKSFFYGDFPPSTEPEAEGLTGFASASEGSATDGVEEEPPSSTHFFPTPAPADPEPVQAEEPAVPEQVEPVPSEGEGEGGQRSEAEQGGEDGTSVPSRARAKKIVWHILDDKRRRIVYINGKPTHIPFRVLERQGDVMKVVRMRNGVYYRKEDGYHFMPQTVLFKNYFEVFEPIPYDDLIVGTLDVETPTLQKGKGDNAEIWLVGAGVRYPDGSFEDAYFEDIYSALLWLKSKGIHILVGHNLFGYDMTLRPSEWERAGGIKSWDKFRKEQNNYEYVHFYSFREFAVVDTQLLTFKAEQMGTAKFVERDLFSVASRLGVAVREEKPEWEDVCEDMEQVKERLRGDLLEAIAVFRAMWKPIHPVLYYVPVGIQDLFLKATGSLVCYILVHEAIKQGEPIPVPEEIGDYQGADVFAEVGMYHHIIYADVASLYPNIMLNEEGCCRPFVRKVLGELTRKRRELKKRGQQGDAEAERLQNALKILINSFYGFHGTDGLPFNRRDIASNITAKGRELLGKMMERASVRGKVVSADTDGIYVSFPAPPTPEDHKFLQEMLSEEGYDLETEEYDAILVRAKKNYILYKRTENGEYEPIKIKGSSLKNKSRTEAYKELVDILVREVPSGRFSVDRTVAHIHRLLYEHHKHIVPTKVSADARETYPHLLTDADVDGDYFYLYYTVGITKTGQYSYSQKGTIRITKKRKAIEEITVPPNLQKHANDLLNAVHLFVDYIGEDTYQEIRQRVKTLIPPAEEWVRIWEQREA
jgi:hypothetical protein